MQTEIEAKFFITSKSAMREQLFKAGLLCKKPERLLRRCNFQFKADFTAGTKWARVRDEGDKVTMSVKEITNINDVQGTQEAEVIVHDFDAACALLTACGLHATSLHENYRETWEAQGVVVTIDTWPELDPVLEIEAVDVARLDSVCASLGLDRNDAFYKPIDFIYGEKLGLAPEVVLKWPEISFTCPPSVAKEKVA